MALAEIARVDASIASFVLIHSHLVVNTIGKFIVASNSLLLLLLLSFFSIK